MSKIRLHGSSSGYTEIAPVAASGNNTITLPDSGTIVAHDANGVVGVTSVVTDTIKVGTAVTIGESGVNVVGVVTATSGIVGLTSTGMPAGSIVQVLQTQKTDTFTSSNSTWVDITGLSQSITMTSASNKVLVQVNLSILNGTTTGSISALKRDSTFIGLAASGYGNRQNGLGAELYNPRSDVTRTTSYSVLDTPGTGTHTYKVVVDPNSYTVYVNRSEADGDTDDYSRGTSDIILMEIAA